MKPTRPTLRLAPVPGLVEPYVEEVPPAPEHGGLVRLLAVESDAGYAGRLLVELARADGRIRLIGLACEVDGAAALAAAARPDLLLVGSVGDVDVHRLVRTLHAASRAPIVAFLGLGGICEAMVGSLHELCGFVPRSLDPAVLGGVLYEIAQLARACQPGP